MKNSVVAIVLLFALVVGFLIGVVVRAENNKALKSKLEECQKNEFPPINPDCKIYCPNGSGEYRVY